MEFETTLHELMAKLERGEVSKNEVIDTLIELHNHKLKNAKQVGELRKGIIEKLLSEKKEIK